MLKGNLATTALTFIQAVLGKAESARRRLGVIRPAERVEQPP
jgi:hypothetical protein